MIGFVTPKAFKLHIKNENIISPTNIPFGYMYHIIYFLDGPIKSYRTKLNRIKYKKKTHFVSYTVKYSWTHCERTSWTICDQNINL